MKPSISISTFKPKFAPITYQTETLMEFEIACQKAHEYGYLGVDLFINKKTEQEIFQIKEILDKYNIRVSMLICIYLAEKGVNFTYVDEAMRKKACETYIEEMKWAKLLNAKTMPIGLIRGKINDGEDQVAYYDRLAVSCRELAIGASNNGIELCIEPINRYEINSLMSLKETVEFIKKYNLDDIKVVPDLFHMNIEDVNISQTLINAGKYIGHMHVSDSNRRAPGMGNLDYKTILAALKSIGYDGYITIETLNFNETELTAKQGAYYLNKILNSLKGE